LAEPAAAAAAGLGWRVAALFHPYAIRPSTEKILVIARSSSKLPKHAVSQIFFSLSSNLCVPASSGQIGFGTAFILL
jgi:ABC-type Co2+ transport system permease subunit